MARQVRWGILGYAKIAKDSLIPALLRAGNSKFYALASRDPQKLTECQSLFGDFKAYNSYEQLLADPEVEAVYLPLPNSLHQEWTIKAARQGKHVLCEKTIALNSSQCRQMIQVCRANRVWLMEGFMYRYTDRTRQLMQLLDQRLIGEIKYINSCYRFCLDREHDIRFRPELGGGALLDVGCYPLNFCTMILNDSPLDLTVICQLERGVDTILSATLKYPSGVIANLNCGFNAFPRIYSEIVGTAGYIEIPDTFLGNAGVITVVTAAGKSEFPVQASDRYQLQVEDFAAAILEGRPPRLDPAESLRNMEIIDRLLALAWRRS